MQYRKLGKLDWQPSALGFGAMRLPTHDQDPARINVSATREMLEYAIGNGVNYLDTAWPYHQGKSEEVIGEFLQEGYRDKIKLATKMPVWEVKEVKDFDLFFNQQLKKLQTERIDFYLLHALNQKNWKKVYDLGVLDWCVKQKNQGLISSLGFSFHDQYPVFRQIIDAYGEWDFCQIQYNFMDIDYQAGKKGLQYAHDHDIGVIVMEPLRGGQLAKEPPSAISEIWKDSGSGRNQVDAALQWLWNQAEVGLVLSGMSNLDQVKENIVSANKSGINLLSDADLMVFEQVREAYLERIAIPCTGCRYCLPCPQNIDIPAVFDIYNTGIIYEDIAKARMFYNWLKPDTRADRCLACGECEDKCPQKIKIIDGLEKAHKELAEGGKL